MNAISELQEYMQKNGYPLPSYDYEVLPSPRHHSGRIEGQNHFTCKVTMKVNNIEVITSTPVGKTYPSKKDAKLEAASEALKKLPAPTLSPTSAPNALNESRTQLNEGPRLMNEFLIEKLIDRSRSGSYRWIVIVDLENVPQAGQLRYSPDVYVIFILSHNHAYYCSNAGKFLYSMPENQCVEVVRSSLKDAADHYISFLAGYLIASLGPNLPEKLFIVSRDNAGACSAFCAQSKIRESTQVEHITNINDMKELLC